MFKFTVKIKINAAGATQNVVIQADNQYAAKQIAEMQYGKSTILFVGTGSR